VDAQPGEPRAGRWIPLPQSSSWAAAASRSLPHTTSGVPVIRYVLDACRGAAGRLKNLRPGG